MSDVEEEELLGEQPEIKGEGAGEPLGQFPIEEKIVFEKYLSFEDASRSLNTLGKDESGMRYAYLMMSPIDMKLTNICMILNFKHILFVDVSGNFLNLDALQVLVDMPYLILLKAERNRIECEALNPMPFLQVLCLARNYITETCGFNQPLLECLDLNYNQLYTAQFDVERLPSLKQLEMRGNNLFDISGSYPTTVEKLYLAENRISRFVPADISKLVNLKILHLRDNQIRKLNGFTEYLVNLKYLNLRKNKINKFRQFRKLQCIPNLETLIILQNPVAGEQEEKTGEDQDDEEADAEEEPKDPTRIPILILLPNLKRINKVPVTAEEREEAYESREDRYAEIMEEDSSEDEVDMPTTTEGTTTGYTTDVEGDETEEG